MMPYADHNLRVNTEENHSISYYSMDAAFERLSPRDTNSGRGPMGWTTASAAKARAVVSANASPDPEGEGVRGCCVGKRDVLCGKDKICYTHPGNKIYRALIASYFREYQGAARRDVKTQITAFIVAEVEQSGGRFLKPSGAPSPSSAAAWSSPVAAACCPDMGRWELEDMDKVHDKVSHALRTAKERGFSRKEREPGEDDGNGDIFFPSNKRARRRGPRAPAAAAAAARGPSFGEAVSSRRESASSRLPMLDDVDLDGLEPLDADTSTVFDLMF
jgi:hypothetical protein